MNNNKCFYFLLLLQYSLCSIKIIPVIEDQTYITNIFLKQSPSNETHLFYSYQVSNIIKYTKHSIAKEALNKLIDNREYLYSNKEYIDFIKPDKLYYIHNNEKIKLNSNDKIYDFLIMKDKSIIIVSHKEKGPIKYLNLFSFKYPPKKNADYFYENENIIIPSNAKLHVIDCSNYIFIFLNGYIHKNILMYIFDEKLQKKYYKEIMEDNNYPMIKTTYLDDNRDMIIICTLENFGGVECYDAKYQKKFITGNKLKIFSNCEFYNDDNFVMSLIENNKIAAVCTNQYNIYYSLIQFSDNVLKLGLYNNMELPLENKYKLFSFYNPVIHFDQNKGVVLFFTMSNYNTFTENIVKSYLNETCISFDINGINPNENVLLDFENNINSIIKEKNKKLIITYIDKEIELYKNNEKFYINTEFNVDDKIYVKLEDSYKPLILYYRYENDKCQIKFKIKESYIFIMGEKYRCLLNKKYKEPNNIIFHELNNKKFYLNKKVFNFTIIFEKEVENNINFYFLNKIIECQKDEENEHKIFCKGTLPKLSSDIYNHDYYIYSELSCLNKIKIGPMKIRDEYLKEIYDINNMTKITQNINKKYNPEEKIKNFSVDMITYYYWFSGLSYCDDNSIEKENCCKDEILDDWEVLKHKEYKISLVERLLNFASIPFLDNIFKIIKIIFDNIQPYIYNFIILKSKKYKKYIFGFPGTTGVRQLLYEIIGSTFTVFDSKEPDIKVEKFFYETFSLIYKELFSDSIINELKTNPDYQIIFTGHSLGGAIATLSSYYYAKNKLSPNEPLLITFGQPRIGNINFAKRYMELIPLVFRIARKGDIVTIIPPAKKLGGLKFFNFFHNFKYQMKNLENEMKKIMGSNGILEKIEKILEFIIRLIFTIIHLLVTFILGLIFKLPIFPHDYCHIGGLYYLIDDKFYQCSDFYNEETGHPICNNWEYENIYDIKNIFDNHGYLKFGEELIGKCQKGKSFWPF